MLQREVRFQLNQPYVVAENFGDEVVAIHLERGAYYSIEKSGAAIWSLAINGATPEEIAQQLTRDYQGDLPAVQMAVQRFLSDLQQADLIAPSVTPSRAATPSAPSQPVLKHLLRQAFVQPVLHEYTDMQDLLLLDPIHDVDDTGWPKRKAV